MNRQDALEALKSDDPHVRLKAARSLNQTASQEDILFLRHVRAEESTSYVQRSLDATIGKLSETNAKPIIKPPDEFDIPDDLRKQVEIQAMEHVAGILLHEIASPVGLIRNAAETEFSNFANSKTKEYLDTLEHIFEDIEQLTSAAATPKPSEFDLAILGFRDYQKKYLTGESWPIHD